MFDLGAHMNGEALFAVKVGQFRKNKITLSLVVEACTSKGRKVMITSNC